MHLHILFCDRVQVASVANNVMLVKWHLSMRAVISPRAQCAMCVLILALIITSSIFNTKWAKACCPLSKFLFKTGQEEMRTINIFGAMHFLLRSFFLIHADINSCFSLIILTCRSGDNAMWTLVWCSSVDAIVVLVGLVFTDFSLISHSKTHSKK